MGFTQLHIHTNYSQLDGIGSSEQYAEKALQLNHKALAITDHGKLNGIYEHQLACLNVGVKPLIGCEMYLQDNLEVIENNGKKEKRIRTKNNHIIILVKNDIGYKNLLKLNYLSNKDTKHFYYSPRITTSELFENSEGLIIGTACMAGPFGRLMIEGKEKECDLLFKKYIQCFGENMFVEIQLNEIFNTIGEANAGQKTINNKLIQLANKFGIPLVITGDVHYLNPGQDKIQTLAIAIRNKNTIDNLTFELESKHLYYHDTEDYIKFNEMWNYGYKKSDIIEWCNNSVHIADKCNFLIPERTKMHLPKITEDDDAFLVKEARKGLQQRLKVSNWSDVPKEYKDRLNVELEIILRKGLSSYINILQDIFNFVKVNGYYRGVGRGSGAGSLVLYVLDITTIDPIKYDLLFERFLSAQRAPDCVCDYFCK